MSKILLAEDEELLANEVREWLQSEQYVVEVTKDGIAADKSLTLSKYDVVILDWTLPGMSGLEVCKRFRNAGGQTPVLMLTARTSIDCKEAGLDAGADDYMTKPFNMKELSARIRSLLRRVNVSPAVKMQIGDVVIDPKTRVVTKGGRDVHLEPREFNLLEFLSRHRNVAFTSEALIQRVWESYAHVTPETLRSYIKSIRKKLDSDSQPSIITTVHGSGYMIRRTDV